MSNLAEIMLKLDEGFRSKPYYCTEQYPSIGFGRVIGVKNAPLTSEVTTKEKEIVFVRQRIQEIESSLQKHQPSAWMKCNESRKAVLVGMAYQMGVTGVLAFKKMWEALSRGDFESASKEMLNSKWAVQTKNRAKRYSDQMKIGSLHMYYLSQGVFI